MVWSPDYLGSPGKVVLSNPLTCTNTPKGENKLYSDAKGVVPSLDLRFAEGKNLNDYMTGTPLVDHQRSINSSTFSPGTFVNSNGLIETAKANYALYSETLTASWWSGGQFISISDTTDVNPPTGIQNIYKVTETADTGEHFFRGSQVNLAVTAGVPNGTVVTISIYLNTSLGRSKVRVYSFGQNNLTFIWDLVNNAQIGTISGGTSPTINSQSLGNNWYRFSFTDTATTSSNLRPVFQTVNNLNQFNYAGDTTKGFYASGFQVEIGTTATTYIPTTNVPSAAPRFDHNPTTGESLGLLIEESRTNLIVYSENFDTTTTSWFNVTGGTGQTPAITPNAAVSPDGTSNATQIDFDVTGGSTGGDVSTISQTYSANATNYTLSAWIKADSNFNLVFDHNTGTVNTVSVTTEWQRITYTKLNASGSRQVRIGLRGDLPVPQTATIYIWGVQIEEGSFPTSYIPTSGTALTRSADVASITGSNFTSRYNQSEGTIFGDYGWTVSAKNRVSTAAGTGTNGNNGFLRAVGTTVTIPRIKQAIGLTNFSAGNIATPDNQISYLNGSLGGNLANIVFPDYPPDLQIGRQTGSSIGYLNGYVARLTYFPERLPDATLQAITA
jgi:hypothetical protein